MTSVEPVVDGLRPPVPVMPPRNMICLGKNYREHAVEFAAFSGRRRARRARRSSSPSP